MSYPCLEQYQDALQNIRFALTDKELSCGTISTSGLGLPLAISGGFALTYTINTQNSKYAVRCFHRQSSALEERYTAISKSITALKSDYFVKFEFQPNGVKVRGNTFPVVKMEWAKGTTLSEFIEANYKNKVALDSLTKALQQLALFLESNNIAHGDIQPGNLMVSGAGTRLQLIDYDGMYVQGISHLGSSELGHRNFQHPKRDETIFDKNLDRFSFITLAMSLKALQENSDFWTASNSEPEAIIFRANDFSDPASSSIFQKLKSYPALSADASNFAAICTSDYNSIPTLSEFASGSNIPGAVSIPPTGQKEYISQYLVLCAADYTAFVLNIGRKVELVGQIFEVKNQTTRLGRPYAFINFANWRGDCVKLSIWSETLGKMSIKPDASWKGRWVSVSGLVDPIYHSSRYNYSHVGITITAPNQIHTIPAAEAAYRLCGNVKNTNHMENKDGHWEGPSKNFSNQEIVREIEHTGTRAYRQQRRRKKPHYTQPNQAKNSWCLAWCIIAVLAYCGYLLFSRGFLR